MPNTRKVDLRMSNSNYILLYAAILDTKRIKSEGQLWGDGCSGWFKWMWKEYVYTVDTEVLRSARGHGRFTFCNIYYPSPT